MPKRLTVPATNRDLLEAAGYAWYTDDGLWEHRTSRRQIIAEIATRMNSEQIGQWIAEGEDRRPDS